MPCEQFGFEHYLDKSQCAMLWAHWQRNGLFLNRFLLLHGPSALYFNLALTSDEILPGNAAQRFEYEQDTGVLGSSIQ